MSIKRLVFGVFLGLLSGTVFASGLSGGFGRSNFPSNSVPVDPAYNYGKSVFTGSIRKYPEFKFCLKSSDSDKGLKIKRKSIKTYKKSNAGDLVANIHNCGNSDENITQVLAQEDVAAVIYYLNKRYKLKLR